MILSYLQDQSSVFETVPYSTGSGMSGGNWQQSSTAAAPAWTATAAEEDNWGERALSSPDYASTLGGGMVTSPAGTVASVASSQELALMAGSLAGAEEFVSEQARSSSVPADMYFGASNVHELSQQQHQQMSHLSEHIETVLDEESFPI